MADKLEWITHNLGPGADLSSFTSNFLKLFGDKLRGAIQQRLASLELYGMYDPDCKYKEADLEPRRYWRSFRGSGIQRPPSRCRACSKAPRKTLIPAKFCSEACVAAAG